MKTQLLVATFLVLPELPLLAVEPGSTAVSSEIAGFIPMTIPGGPGDGTAQLSLKAIGLVQPVEHRGVSEAARSNVLFDDDADWTDNQFSPPHATAATATHFVEITTGPRAGLLFDIIGTDQARHRLKLAQALPKNIGTRVGYHIRRHWTIADVFGPHNEAGLLAGAATEADQIWIYDGPKYEAYFFSTGEQGDGWRKVDGGTDDRATRKIYPDDGLVIQRKGVGAIQPIVKGMVKTGPALIPIRKGLNIVGNVYAAPLTFASSRLYTGNTATGVRAGATAAAADKVLLFNGTDYDSYYYQRNANYGNGWRREGDRVTDMRETPIDAGSAVAIKRRGTTGFNWKVPQHPTQD
jgi:uncharacterized protein (TIGR02597 family)